MLPRVVRNGYIAALGLSLICSSVFIQDAWARDVWVKYRDTPVEVDGFKEYRLKPSSFVNEIFYDDENAYLLVRLNNTFYHYCQIPEKVVEGWVAAASLGKYYHQYIRGQYSCRQS